GDRAARELGRAPGSRRGVQVGGACRRHTGAAGDGNVAASARRSNVVPHVCPRPPDRHPPQPRPARTRVRPPLIRASGTFSSPHKERHRGTVTGWYLAVVVASRVDVVFAFDSHIRPLKSRARATHPL